MKQGTDLAGANFAGRVAPLRWSNCSLLLQSLGSWSPSCCRRFKRHAKRHAARNARTTSRISLWPHSLTREPPNIFQSMRTSTTTRRTNVTLTQDNGEARDARSVYRRGNIERCRLDCIRFAALEEQSLVRPVQALSRQKVVLRKAGTQQESTRPCAGFCIATIRSDVSVRRVSWPA